MGLICLNLMTENQFSSHAKVLYGCKVAFNVYIYVFFMILRQ